MTIGDARYIRFTTFRRTGEPVPTPVWIAPFGGEVVFSTHPQAGKVKRLRNDPRVEIAACGVRGEVKEGAEVFTGTARLLSDGDHAAAREALQSKYGVQWRLLGLGQALRRLVGRHPGEAYIAIAVGALVRTEPAVTD